MSRTISTSRTIATVVTMLLAGAALIAPLSAQSAKGAASGKPAKAHGPAVAGQYAGTVTVQLGDSTIMAPVFYTFTDSAGTTIGTAMVPGQGTGPVSHFVRSGDGVRFRVTAKQADKMRLLEHDAKVGADGAVEGMVNLDGKPVAKFRIVPSMPKKDAKK